MLPGIGVFGTGSEVKVLVPVLRERGFHIQAIWGRNLREAEAAARDLDIAFYTHKIDDVLLRNGVDLVFINCPPYLHSQISVKALGIGKHVVCDKPMGLGPADALKMVRAAQYYPSLITLVNHSLRFLPAIVHMRRALRDGYAGATLADVTLIDVRVQMGSLLHDHYDWLCDAAMGGGALNLIGSHVIDVVSFLCAGNRAVRVHGVVRTHTRHTEHVHGIRQVTAPDFCNFQMELEGGQLVTVALHSNSASRTFSQEVLVCGRDGHLVVRGGDLFGQRRVAASGGGQPDKEEALYVDVQDLHCSTSGTLLPRPYVKGLCKMVGALRESFVQEPGRWVKEPVRAAATFEDGLYVQAVLDAIRASSESRSWMKVNVMSESPVTQAKRMSTTAAVAARLASGASVALH